MRSKLFTAIEPLERVLLVVSSIAVCVLAYGYLHGQHRLGQYAVASVQQNVDARYDDCRQLNRVLAAQRIGVTQSRTTVPLLYKLVPTLNTAAVRTLVHQNWARELQEYAAVDCKSYARRAIPHGDVHPYHVP
jgi:hypothetical protein